MTTAIFTMRRALVALLPKPEQHRPLLETLAGDLAGMLDLDEGTEGTPENGSYERCAVAMAGLSAIARAAPRHLCIARRIRRRLCAAGKSVCLRSCCVDVRSC